MPSFKNSTAGVVPNDEVNSYVPVNFDNEAQAQTAQSFAFVDSQKTSAHSHFEIDPRISQSIGLTEAKNRESKKQFDGEVMRYVQKIKDDAYQEAYKVGLEKGIADAREAAYAEAQDEMKAKLKAVIEIGESLVQCREKMLAVNEQEIIQFSYFMAEKIIFRELKQDPSLIVSAIKTIAVHQDEITVRVSAADYQYLQPYLETLGTEMNIAHVRFEKDESLKLGDIMVESKQGIVDGTLQTRMNKLKLLLDGQE